MIRQIIGRPSLSVMGWLLLLAGRDRCPRAGIPLSGPAAVTGPAAGISPRQGLVAAAATASQAQAHSASVTCRYHAPCLRTW
jgi:hypothetical protein